MHSAIDPTFPDVRWYEYAYRKFFCPTEIYSTWAQTKEWDYPDKDITRFTSIISDNVELINGHTVLELGCHIGYLTMFCLHNGATSVTATNIRERELAIGREVADLAGFSNAKFLVSNVMDYEELAKLASAHNTILVAGLIYHLTDLVGFFRTLSNSSAENLIIETEINDVDDTTPICVGKLEDASSSTNGLAVDSTSECLVHVPNIKYVTFILTHFGWTIEKESIFTMSSANGRVHRRATIVAVKHR